MASVFTTSPNDDGRSVLTVLFQPRGLAVGYPLNVLVSER